MTLLLGIETKIATIPKAIRPSSAQNSVRAHEREVSARGVAVRAAAPATNAAVAPAACHSADGSALA